MYVYSSNRGEYIITESSHSAVLMKIMLATTNLSTSTVCWKMWNIFARLCMLMSRKAVFGYDFNCNNQNQQEMLWMIYACDWMLLECFAQNKEVISLREDHEQLMEMKTEVQRLHALEHTCRLSADRITELELIIVQLTAELEQEKLEKESALNEKDAIEKESQLVRGISSAFVICYFICMHMTKLNVFLTT